MRAQTAVLALRTWSCAEGAAAVLGWQSFSSTSSAASLKSTPAFAFDIDGVLKRGSKVRPRRATNRAFLAWSHDEEWLLCVSDISEHLFECVGAPSGNFSHQSGCQLAFCVLDQWRW
jgi:hypothetical protein